MSALHSAAYREFARALAEARTKAGFTQRALAAALGTDHSFVAKYETARVRLDVIQFLTIAAALKTDPAEILGKISTGTLDGPILPKPPKGEKAGSARDASQS